MSRPRGPDGWPGLLLPHSDLSPTVAESLPFYPLVLTLVVCDSDWSRSDPSVMRSSGRRRAGGGARNGARCGGGGRGAPGRRCSGLFRVLGDSMIRARAANQPGLGSGLPSGSPDGSPVSPGSNQARQPRARAAGQAVTNRPGPGRAAAGACSWPGPALLLSGPAPPRLPGRGRGKLSNTRVVRMTDGPAARAAGARAGSDVKVIRHDGYS